MAKINYTIIKDGEAWYAFQGSRTGYFHKGIKNPIELNSVDSIDGFYFKTYREIVRKVKEHSTKKLGRVKQTKGLIVFEEIK